MGVFQLSAVFSVNNHLETHKCFNTGIHTIGKDAVFLCSGSKLSGEKVLSDKHPERIKIKCFSLIYNAIITWLMLTYTVKQSKSFLQL